MFWGGNFTIVKDSYIANENYNKAQDETKLKVSDHVEKMMGEIWKDKEGNVKEYKMPKPEDGSVATSEELVYITS